jgi:hypothetical protein
MSQIGRASYNPGCRNSRLELEFIYLNDQALAAHRVRRLGKKIGVSAF